MQGIAAAGAIVATLLFYTTVASGQPSSLSVYKLETSGLGEEIGVIEVRDSEYGLVLSPNLTGLSPGIHGFHLHETPSCDPARRDGELVPGLGAGGHFDPEGTGVHEGPYGNGHLGDLPPLYVSESGEATLPLLAPRLTVADLRGRALIVHAGGDNYSDEPQPLGGGGARVACTVID